jgi:hypothetical protein
LRYTQELLFPLNPVIYQCNHFVVNILFLHVVSFNNRLQIGAQRGAEVNNLSEKK